MKSEFEELLKRAQECGVKISASRSGTRANGLAVAYLETAQLWARQDREEKEYIAKMQGSPLVESQAPDLSTDGAAGVSKPQTEG